MIILLLFFITIFLYINIFILKKGALLASLITLIKIRCLRLEIKQLIIQTNIQPTVDIQIIESLRTRNYMFRKALNQLFYLNQLENITLIEEHLCTLEKIINHYFANYKLLQFHFKQKRFFHEMNNILYDLENDLKIINTYETYG